MARKPPTAGFKKGQKKPEGSGRQVGDQKSLRHHQLGFCSFPTPHTRGAKKWTAQPPASGSNTLFNAYFRKSPNRAH